ncbi:NAD dependent epimerase/dehydratase [Sphingomonas sp. DBB INV C78]|uniref:hypothetical protein n=1 Tax=Sphingomonas sp. DBB INV C78 TaxID=3349434 RepID=UPI0036D39805
MAKLIVAGSTGVTGNAMMRHFSRLPEWEVVSVARRSPALAFDGVNHINVDLSDEGACHEAFGAMSDATHLIYAAVNENDRDIIAGWADEAQIEKNVQMLANIVEPLTQSASGFQQAVLVHGLKAYGSHLPHITTQLPFKESDASYRDLNFYHRQQEYIVDRQLGTEWSWTILRPGGTIGVAIGGNMNWSLVLAVLAALCAEAGEPLPMPAGNSGIFEMTDSDLIASASEWAFATPGARNQVFNVTNGDVFALHDIFPILADSFGIALTEPRHVDIAGELTRLAHHWPTVVDRFGLVAPRSLDVLLGATPQIVSAWGESMPPERKLMSGLTSTIKLRHAGFENCADSADTIRKYVDRYRELRILP